ncbi:MAG: MarR family winged helix-turn-helix transcriptional regulator [Clostridiales bacterium]|nr:MarR family winged helix-turn-helix transcriptional regulator [Clostridiales bacterium]
MTEIDKNRDIDRAELLGAKETESKLESLTNNFKPQNGQKPFMMVIRNTYKLWSDYMKSIAMEAGIPDSYRMVLTYLLRHPGANQKDIAIYRDVKTATISQAVKEMQLRGYLEKESDPDDQRYVKLYLTEKGRTCAEELHQRIQHADACITEFLTPEREREMIGIMQELSEFIGKELPSCPGGH